MKLKNHTNPKFSIIVPVYNLESFIEECLNSLLLQNFESWEAIVVNDGSLDNSLQIIKSYSEKDKRFKIIDKPNGGLSAARNDAMRLCTGEYIIFLDGDDWLDNAALGTIHSLIGNSEVDLLVHQMNYYYTENNSKVFDTKVVEGNYTGIDFLHTILINKKYNSFVAPAKAYRTQFLRQYQLSFIQGILHEDGPFFFEVCHKAQNVLFSNKALYYYRQNREGQITASTTFKNYRGVIVGIENNMRLYGRDDKIINGAMLNNYCFLAGKYITKIDKVNAFSDLRTWKTKSLLLHYLVCSKTDFKVWFRGFLLLVDPLLLNIVYRMWF